MLRELLNRFDEHWGKSKRVVFNVRPQRMKNYFKFGEKLRLFTLQKTCFTVSSIILTFSISQLINYFLNIPE